MCKSKDKITAEYALNNIVSPVGVSTYEVSEVLSKKIMAELPTEEELNLHIEVGE